MIEQSPVMLSKVYAVRCRLDYSLPPGSTWMCGRVRPSNPIRTPRNHLTQEWTRDRREPCTALIVSLLLPPARPVSPRPQAGNQRLRHAASFLAGWLASDPASSYELRPGLAFRVWCNGRSDQPPSSWRLEMLILT